MDLLVGSALEPAAPRSEPRTPREQGEKKFQCLGSEMRSFD
jgi:hypothetical protein